MKNDKINAYRELDNIIQELREEHPEQVFWSLALTCMEAAVHELIASEAKHQSEADARSILAKKNLMKELLNDRT